MAAFLFSCIVCKSAQVRIRDGNYWHVPQLFSFVRLLTGELRGSSRCIGIRDLARESRQLGSLIASGRLSSIVSRSGAVLAPV